MLASTTTKNAGPIVAHSRSALPLMSRGATARQPTGALAVALPLILGGLIYALFRSEGLVAFAWADHLGLRPILSFARDAAMPLRRALPDWFRYSLPDGLWLFSLLAMVQLVWSSSTRAMNAVQRSATVSAFSLEFSQAVWPRLGTFCWMDLVALTAASLCFHAAAHRHLGRKDDGKSVP